MRLFAIFLLGWLAAGQAAGWEFIGVMSDPRQAVFAVREEKSSWARWVSVGEQLDEYRIAAYDAKAETLTLEKAGQRRVLTLLRGRVHVARDEVVAALERILKTTGAERLRDFLHPKLKPLFKEEDLENGGFRGILERGTKLEIRELPREVAEALAAGLTEVEQAVGERPTHGLWIFRETGFSMSFVVKSGDGWHLAPSVPKIR